MTCFLRQSLAVFSILLVTTHAADCRVPQWGEELGTAVNDLPTTATNAHIQITFYTNTAQTGSESRQLPREFEQLVVAGLGDDCPVACTSSNQAMQQV